MQLENSDKKDISTYQVIIRLLSKASQDPRLHLNEVKLLVYLCTTYVEKDKKNLELSQRNLSMTLSFEIADLTEAISQLESHGYLIKFAHPETGLETYGLAMPDSDVLLPEGTLIN